MTNNYFSTCACHSFPFLFLLFEEECLLWIDSPEELPPPSTLWWSPDDYTERAVQMGRLVVNNTFCLSFVRSVSYPSACCTNKRIASLTMDTSSGTQAWNDTRHLMSVFLIPRVVFGAFPFNFRRKRCVRKADLSEIRSSRESRISQSFRFFFRVTTCKCSTSEVALPFPGLATVAALGLIHLLK